VGTRAAARASIWGQLALAGRISDIGVSSYLAGEELSDCANKSNAGSDVVVVRLGWSEVFGAITQWSTAASTDHQDHVMRAVRNSRNPDLPSHRFRVNRSEDRLFFLPHPTSAVARQFSVPATHGEVHQLRQSVKL
jgi:hypothetical protein